MQPFCDWLSHTHASLTIQTVMWIIPAVQTVHILCVAVVMTSMAMLDFRLLGFAGRDSVSGTVRRFVPRVWYTLPFMVVTGIILIIGEPDRELLNPYFRAKMVMLAVVLAITLAVQGLSKKDSALGDAQSRRGRRRIRFVVTVDLDPSPRGAGSRITKKIAREARLLRPLLRSANLC